MTGISFMLKYSFNQCVINSDQINETSGCNTINLKHILEIIVRYDILVRPMLVKGFLDDDLIPIMKR